MGIDYSPVLGVGVDQEEITYQVLTEFAKNELLEMFKDYGSMEIHFEELYDDELGWSKVPKEDLESALEDFYAEVKFGEGFLYDLGLTELEGNYYSGWYGNVGVGISLNIDGMKEQVESAVNEFKKVVNLEPEIFTGVLVH